MQRVTHAVAVIGGVMANVETQGGKHVLLAGNSESMLERPLVK